MGKNTHPRENYPLSEHAVTQVLRLYLFLSM